MTQVLSRHLRFSAVWALLVLSAGLACAQTGGDAKIVVMTGQVNVLRDGATWALSMGDLVHPDQLIVTGPDGYAQLRVADGSTFEVFQNARVAFRDNRGNWRDLLEIFLGKVKISIEHAGGQNPNTVRTPTAVIAVRGTVFDIDVEDGDATTLILCEEGRVEVTHLIQSGRGQVLNAGEWVRVFKNMPLQAKAVDRGALLQRAVRAASDAVNEIIYRSPRGSTPGATGNAGTPAGGTSSGDKSGSPTPVGTPPPPPPPPPPAI